MKKCFNVAFLAILLASAWSCTDPSAAEEMSDADTVFEKGSLYLDRIKLPEGFQISTYASDVDNARSMSLSPGGTLFVGTRAKGSVYAIRDTDGDMQGDKVITIDEDLNMPNGVAFNDGDLYVAEVNRILKYADIESNLENAPEPEVIFDDLPSARHHGWKFIAFGPDGKLYIPIGAPCNICESADEEYASITRINKDGSGFEVVQHGVRNTVGFTWDAESGDLWFTDNGRDWMGDESPACELNRASIDGLHFGYPYCHQGDISDPDFGDKRACEEFEAPAKNLDPHCAPLGIEFYTASQFPSEYRGQAFIAEHGSWNKANGKSGFRISLVNVENKIATSYENFASGWLDEESQEVWGRPVDIEWMPDGSMLVSDDQGDAIYRISYGG